MSFHRTLGEASYIEATCLPEKKSKFNVQFLKHTQAKSILNLIKSMNFWDYRNGVSNWTRTYFYPSSRKTVPWNVKRNGQYYRVLLISELTCGEKDAKYGRLNENITFSMRKIGHIRSIR